MSERNKVTPNARAKIVDLAGKGVSRRAIAEALKEDGVEITHQAVTLLLKNLKGPRARAGKVQARRRVAVGKGAGGVLAKRRAKNEEGTRESAPPAPMPPREPSKQQKSALESTAQHLDEMRREVLPPNASPQAAGAFRIYMIAVDMLFATVNEAITGDERREPVTAAMREIRALQAAYYATLPPAPPPPPDPVADPHNVAALAIVEHYLDSELEGFEARLGILEGVG